MNAEPPVITSAYWWKLHPGGAMVAWGFVFLLASFGVFRSVMTRMLALLTLPIGGVLLAIGHARSRNRSASPLRQSAGSGLLLLVHEALDALAREDPLKAEIVKLRYFVGLNHQEIAQAFNVNEKTVRRHWEVAKVRLYELISDQHAPTEPGSPGKR